jgi:hypothetical protein
MMPPLDVSAMASRVSPHPAPLDVALEAAPISEFPILARATLDPYAVPLELQMRPPVPVLSSPWGARAFAEVVARSPRTSEPTLPSEADIAAATFSVSGPTSDAESVSSAPAGSARSPAAPAVKSRSLVCIGSTLSDFCSLHRMVCADCLSGPGAATQTRIIGATDRLQTAPAVVEDTRDGPAQPRWCDMSDCCVHCHVPYIGRALPLLFSPR